MDHKIKIKIGALEIEYEGNESYLKNELPLLLEKLSSLTLPQETTNNNQFNNATINELVISKPEHESISLEMSTNSIAAKISGKTGSELAMSACAQLALVQRKGTFSRPDILAEMKSATNYYKDNYSGNLTRILKTLVTNQKLIERSNSVYAIAADELASLKLKLNAN